MIFIYMALVNSDITDCILAIYNQNYKGPYKTEITENIL